MQRPGGSGTAPYTALWSNAAFIQFAGFTAGKTASFFDFDCNLIRTRPTSGARTTAGSGTEVSAYTAQFGNGMSASLSLEQPYERRMSITNGAIGVVPNGGLTIGGTGQYGNQEIPDVVGNLRIDQTWGSAQVMAAYHQLRAVSSTVPATLVTSDDFAFAFGGGLKFNLPMLGHGDYALVQAGYSEGVISYVGQGVNGGFNLTNNDATSHAIGPAFDAVLTAGNSLDKTKAWSVTGGFEHFWSPNWKTSLYGAYGELKYSDAASAVLAGGPGISMNWNLGQVGSRTVWTPVANLDLSLEVMYNRLNTAAGSVVGFDDKDWVSGIFRVQRNFYP